MVIIEGSGAALFFESEMKAEMDGILDFKILAF
jgi:hypothetical protein